MAVRAKELRYAVDLTTDGGPTDENGVVIEVPAEWSPEHLLLARDCFVGSSLIAKPNYRWVVNGRTIDS